MLLKNSFAGPQAPRAERRINELNRCSPCERGICRTFSTESNDFGTMVPVSQFARRAFSVPNPANYPLDIVSEFAVNRLESDLSSAE